MDPVNLRANDLPRLQRLALLEAVRAGESRGYPEHQVPDGDGGEAIGVYQVHIDTAAHMLDMCKTRRPGCPLTEAERKWLTRILRDRRVNEAIANLWLDHCERNGYRKPLGLLFCYNHGLAGKADPQDAYVQRALPVYISALKRLRRMP